MSADTHYAILGVSETASELEIKAAYRNLLKKIHPDTVSTLSPDVRRMAESATTEIIAAYAVLSEAGSRGEYDRQLAEDRLRSAPAATASPERQRPRDRTRHSTHAHYDGYCDVCGMPLGAGGSCPRCKSPLKRWAFRHPILAICVLTLVLPGILILGLLAIAFILGKVGA
jgi:DnaJ-class molecular chaperone